MFGRKRRKRKYTPKQISVEEARRVLGLLGQRERTICLIMLQSGQSINAILNHVNHQTKYLTRRIAEENM